MSSFLPGTKKGGQPQTGGQRSPRALTTWAGGALQSKPDPPLWLPDTRGRCASRKGARQRLRLPLEGRLWSPRPPSWALRTHREEAPWPYVVPKSFLPVGSADPSPWTPPQVLAVRRDFLSMGRGARGPLPPCAPAPPRWLQTSPARWLDALVTISTETAPDMTGTCWDRHPVHPFSSSPGSSLTWQELLLSRPPIYRKGN